MKDVLMMQVIDAITRHYQVSIADLLYGGRKQNISRARGMTCFLLRKHAMATYHDIGQLLDIHYSTVMYHCQQLQNAADPQTVAERCDAEEYYNLIASMEYDQQIPF